MKNLQIVKLVLGVGGVSLMVISTLSILRKLSKNFKMSSLVMDLNVF